MSTAQMMLTIGATFLLSMVILTNNRGLITTNTTMVNNRYGIIAVSLATSIIERATSKAFDDNTDSVSVTSLSQLTNVNQLGIETGESANNPKAFNDFDDYNCYRDTPKLDTVQLEGTNRIIVFNSKCQVDYVSPNDPSTISNQRTWNKRLIVSVFSQDMADTIKMSTVYSYWYFR